MKTIIIPKLDVGDTATLMMKDDSVLTITVDSIDIRIRKQGNSVLYCYKNPERNDGIDIISEYTNRWYQVF